MELTPPSNWRGKLWVIALALIVLDLAIFASMPPSEVTHLDGTRELLSRGGAVRAAAVTLLVSIPIFTAVLCALAALFPFRGLPYGSKYARIFMPVLVGLYAVVTVVGLLSLLHSSLRP